MDDAERRRRVAARKQLCLGFLGMANIEWPAEWAAVDATGGGHYVAPAVPHPWNEVPGIQDAFFLVFEVAQLAADAAEHHRLGRSDSTAVHTLAALVERVFNSKGAQHRQIEAWVVQAAELLHRANDPDGAVRTIQQGWSSLMTGERMFEALDPALVLSCLAKLKPGRPGRGPTSRSVQSVVGELVASVGALGSDAWADRKKRTAKRVDAARKAAKKQPKQTVGIASRKSGKKAPISR